MVEAIDKKMKQRRTVGRKPGTPSDTPELREKFLEALRQTGNVGKASEIINVYRTTPYQWKRKDPSFAKQWDDALEAAADIVEAEVRRRAVEGFEEPVYYQGKVVGYVTKYSDRMLELLIKGLKPEKFREKNAPDASILIQVQGKEEIEKLRESSPWSNEAKIATGDFKPMTVTVEDLSGRALVAAEGGRAKRTKEGLTETEIAEENEGDD